MRQCVRWPACLGSRSVGRGKVTRIDRDRSLHSSDLRILTPPPAPAPPPRFLSWVCCHSRPDTTTTQPPRWKRGPGWCDKRIRVGLGCGCRSGWNREKSCCATFLFSVTSELPNQPNNQSTKAFNQPTFFSRILAELCFRKPRF